MFAYRLHIGVDFVDVLVLIVGFEFLSFDALLFGFWVCISHFGS